MFTKYYCMPAVVGTPVGVKCTCPKRTYKSLGVAMTHEFSENLVSHLILIKIKPLEKFSNVKRPIFSILYKLTCYYENPVFEKCMYV